MVYRYRNERRSWIEPLEPLEYSLLPSDNTGQRLCVKRERGSERETAEVIQRLFLIFSLLYKCAVGTVVPMIMKDSDTP